MITIQELLLNRGLDPAARIKLVRHTDSGADERPASDYLTDRQAFLDYQTRQRNDVFRGVDYVASFIGEERGTARFVGLFKIDGCTLSDDGLFMYSMHEVPQYADLKERVIVRWPTPRAWHIWFDNQAEVVEIAPGLRYRHFTDFADLILTFPELCELVHAAYPDWQSVLSSVKGVYLITDTLTGRLYVGSAYGDRGIWGRWAEYVATKGHGNNTMLKKLTEEEHEYAAKHFQFSILDILPKTSTPQQAIAREQLYKRKLGSCAFGLNIN